MQRRLYFVVSKLSDAKSVFNQLLLARISDKQFHVLARDDVDIGDLPAATTLQRFDVIHSIITGLGIGAVIGIFVGIIGHGVLSAPIGGAMLATTLLGAVLGAWSSSMIGMMVPNRQLKEFYPAVERGQMLILVDVPLAKVRDIERLITQTVPDARFAGVEPTLPSVP